MRAPDIPGAPCPGETEALQFDLRHHSFIHSIVGCVWHWALGGAGGREKHGEKQPAGWRQTFMQAALSPSRQGHMLLRMGMRSIQRTPRRKDGPAVLKASFP